jgi:hypothetical protein
MKYTGQQRNMYRVSVEEILQKGVKQTLKFEYLKPNAVEDALQNGVKDTTGNLIWSDVNVEDVLQNGVKQTSEGLGLEFIQVEDVLQNGVKKTLSVEEGTFTSIGFEVHVEDVLQNGVKHVRAFVNKGKKVLDNDDNKFLAQKGKDQEWLDQQRLAWEKSPNSVDADVAFHFKNTEGVRRKLAGDQQVITDANNVAIAKYGTIDDLIPKDAKSIDYSSANGKYRYSPKDFVEFI